MSHMRKYCLFNWIKVRNLAYDLTNEFGYAVYMNSAYAEVRHASYLETTSFIPTFCRHYKNLDSDK